MKVLSAFLADVSILQCNHYDRSHSFSQLQEGANGARSDDNRRIKEEVGNCINLELKPDEPLNPKCRLNRGLQHDVCGELLTPIEFDWLDLK